jgi:hypothetical protein
VKKKIEKTWTSKKKKKKSGNICKSSRRKKAWNEKWARRSRD